ncbi:TlpA family protein disulfide reductase [Humisphaera borealis]|uniref:TlpA family protein disulfide reductase n=1 Tax=Humisphaera borealis TaxID=2807512 RepID=A0A7M2X500_9BACT|nr:TlpA disulfide reductase family protein [Humisphaera borealis]QOV91870.1 TlpA family protein disulfide reductase [Humisphaera borealis]
MSSFFSRRGFIGSTLALVAAAGVTASFLPSSVSAAENDTKSLVGKAAPDFDLKTVDGKSAKLSDQKGKVVLIDFWATWCPPCVKSLPHVNELAGKKALTEKGLVVYAVNAREKAPTVEKFIDSKGLKNLTIPMDAQGATMGAYLVQGIPTTVVVGRDGKVSNVFVGSGNDANIDAAVEKALAAK